MKDDDDFSSKVSNSHMMMDDSYYDNDNLRFIHKERKGTGMERGRVQYSTVAQKVVVLASIAAAQRNHN